MFRVSRHTRRNRSGSLTQDGGPGKAGPPGKPATSHAGPLEPARRPSPRPKRCHGPTGVLRHCECQRSRFSSCCSPSRGGKDKLQLPAFDAGALCIWRVLNRVHVSGPGPALAGNVVGGTRSSARFDWRGCAEFTDTSAGNTLLPPTTGAKPQEGSEDAHAWPHPGTWCASSFCFGLQLSRAARFHIAGSHIT